MKTLKLVLPALVIMILLSANLYAQVTFKAYVKNQEVVLNDPDYAGANTVYFDIYLQQTGANPLYLGPATLRFTFDYVNFTIANGSADFLKVSGSTALYNSLGAAISPSFSRQYQESTHLLIISYLGAGPTDQEAFDGNVPKIDATLDKHKLGRFVVKTISNLSGNFNLAWGTGADLSAVLTYATTDPYPTSPATGTYDAITNTPLPVEFTSFIVNIENKRDVKLTWTTITETNNQGFDIERKTTEGTWSKVGNVQGKGTTNEATTYNFDDRKLNTGKYNYRLKQIDYNGNFEYYMLNMLIEVGLPTKFDLSQNYPNPFNPNTKIDFELPLDCRVTLKVYDITGREIAALLNNEFKTADYYTIRFDASNFASGIYFYRLQTEKFMNVKRMVLIK